MKNSSRMLLLLGGLILIIMSVLCFAKGDNSASSASQTYSFAEQPFDAIKLAGNFEMTVQVTHQPHTANVVVNASNDLLSDIKVYVKNKTLYVSSKNDVDDDWEFHPFKKNKRIKLLVNVDNLESIKTKRSCNCHVNNIKTDNFSAEINGSGNIVLQGNTKNLVLEINGSGEVKAKNLIAEQAKLSIRGSGCIVANATQKIDINIQGSGKVEYYGNPPKVEQSMSGSGKIKAMGK